jgi:hypothetical protein
MSDERPTIVITHDWGRDEDRRPGLPWIGVFLVVFGGLLLTEQLLPEYRSLGNVAVLAAGLASLLVWLVSRGTLPLYAGAFLTAAAAPGVLRGLGLDVGPGVGTICYGVALLFIGAVRAVRGGGVGWQALFGLALAALGASQLALPELAAMTLPLALVILGLFLLVGGGRRR